VRGIISLAHNLGLRVVAEGAEDQGDWDTLVDLECDRIQGYFISRPMTAEDTYAWLKQWAAEHSKIWLPF